MSWRKSISSAILLAAGFLILISCSGEPKTFSDVLVKVQGKPVAQAEIMIRDFCQRHDFPFTEDSVAYFLVENKTDSPAFVAGDFTQWRPDSIALKQIGKTHFYFAALKFPLNARLEYKFVIGKQWLLDPLNPFKEQGGYGENSVLMMPKYRFPREALLNPKLRISHLDTLIFKSRLLKNKRKIILYQHPKAKDKAPLLIFNDGSEYLRFARARIILDNLIGDNRIRPINVLFIDPVHRNKEYWLNDKYLRMVFRELLPFVLQRYGLHPDTLGFGGASLGGEIALYALKDYGKQLNFVFSQSGAVWIDNAKVLNVLQSIPEIKTKIYASYGLFEGKGIQQGHQRLKSILKKKNVLFKLEKIPEGHNWGNWRGHLKDALIFLGGK